MEREFSTGAGKPPCAGAAERAGTPVFEYGRKEIDWLKSRDRRLGAIIERIGPVRRTVEPDLFSAVVRNIVSQQISGKAAETVWAKLSSALGGIAPENVGRAGADVLRSCGMSQRKAEYILTFAARVLDGTLDLRVLARLPDAEFVSEMVKLPGIGVWTAEMLLLFSLRRPDILSFGDFGIRRGMRMAYRRREITREQFERCRRRLSPYGSVASLYFWELSGGAIPGITDPGA